MEKKQIKKVLYNIFIKYQGLLILLLIIDQVTKALALNFLKEPVYIFGISWLQLRLQINSGIAFSFLKDAPQWISALVSVVATLALEAYVIIKKPKSKIYNSILLVLIAGALGNGIDRWLAVFGKYTGYTGVVDFIYPTFFANFNFADICVTLSCIALFIYFIFAKDDNEPSNKDFKKAKKELEKNDATNVDKIETVGENNEQ